ncbi:SDR family NAD(P)-dependent oxidoreductase [Bifidobacterium longum]|uniref:SDR family NAD(P)-dependent oxidoreductase n=1 Tax=Bifidobacterium longum TaxID=216816 RepID=UPI000E4849F4|nr:SDR family oxidoreductase [Bifidobacterium longum]RGY53079.1 SDR family NAD(P)-dependent oxidoreductase [Bifidobacterium longum]
MNIKNILKKAARFILSAGQQPVHIEIGTIAPSEMLSGRKIVITGGIRGIGFATAQACIKQGADVLIAGRKESTLQESAKNWVLVLIISCLMCPRRSRRKTSLPRQNLVWGGIDGLICNAGLSLHEESIGKVSPEQFDKQFNTNFRGAYFLAQAYVEEVTSSTKPSDLIFISSETADHCVDIPYGLSKAAINSLIGSLSRRFYRKGVRVNGVAPGVTATDMTKEYADVSDGDYSYEAASGRLFLPEEVAEVVCFLLSSASRCISGEVIHVNAGNHLN